MTAFFACWLAGASVSLLLAFVFLGRPRPLWRAVHILWVWPVLLLCVIGSLFTVDGLKGLRG